MRQFFGAFFDLLRLPKAFWTINLAYTLDAFAYFGILGLLPTFLTDVVRVSDTMATVLNGTFTACVSLFMFGFGSYSERFGVRRALLASLLVLALGRVILSGSAWSPGQAVVIVLVLAALLVMAAGEGVIQTANYSGLKQYSDEKTSAMGFGLNYTVMNVGGLLVGFAASEIRVSVDSSLGVGSASATAPTPAGTQSDWVGWLASFSGSGIAAVFWMCTTVTLVACVASALLFTRRAERAKLRPEDEQRVIQQRKTAAVLPLWERIKAGPFGDARFAFFVFILLPARTLFGYQMHIMTNYILRAYPKEVADRAEWFSVSLNPLVIVLAVPLLTAFTRKLDMYRLMLVGTLVTAVPTFLLTFGERWELLLTYLIVFSFGEALWQPRFYQFAAELAPEGRMGSYMAAANIPWLLAKFLSGVYSGWLLSIFCPATGPRNPGTMWAIYGAFALVSPLGLWLARDWLKAGLHPRQNVTAQPT